MATKADKFLEGLSAAEQRVLQRVFLRIVRPAESGEHTRRRAAFTELPPEGVEFVVKLANERSVLWDLTTNDPAVSRVVVRGHKDAVCVVGITSDSQWLVTGSVDQTARLWLLPVSYLINLAGVTVGRNFSTAEWQLYFPGQPYRNTFPELPDPRFPN